MTTTATLIWTRMTGNWQTSGDYSIHRTPGRRYRLTYGLHRIGKDGTLEQAKQAAEEHAASHPGTEPEPEDEQRPDPTTPITTPTTPDTASDVEPNGRGPDLARTDIFSGRALDELYGPHGGRENVTEEELAAALEDLGWTPAPPTVPGADVGGIPVTVYGGFVRLGSQEYDAGELYGLLSKSESRKLRKALHRAGYRTLAAAVRVNPFQN